MSTLYVAKGLSFSYQLGSQQVTALRSVDLQLNSGSLVCLSGPSGSGKSTLLNLLGLIEEVQEGDILFEGRSFKELDEAGKTQIRKFDIGFVFQSFHLFPVLDAEENVEFFLARQGVAKPERKKRTQEALEAVGLWDHRSKRPLEMSGGQRQRVAVARALAKQPKVIIADEPTASLDQKTGENLMELFKRLNEERNVTFFVSSHDPMVQAVCPLHIRMRDGVIV